MIILNEILSIALTAAPWLLVGFFAAGLIKAFVPEDVLQRLIGGSDLLDIARAAVIGAPLPLCSCGAIPTALALHRGGAGRGPTTAFLIGTPGIGVDSLAITYALLGPFMAIVRASGAVVTAIITGLLVATSDRSATNLPLSPDSVSSDNIACKDTCTCKSVPQNAAKLPFVDRLRNGVSYAFGELLDDIRLWLVIGLVMAGLLLAFVPPQALAAYGSGLGPMLLMAVIGIPLYICATAATPIAAAMLVAGVSPGTVLVFLLAGPITSLATLGVLRREMGNRALGCYLIGIVSTSLVLGVLVDGVVREFSIEVPAQIGAVQELLPLWLEWSALILLILVSLRPVRRMLLLR
ncbi:MAG: SO_0444 family Cu/Zn efflux transporter [Desulfuromonadales bacterium]|nr:SO_0444 family Cu/Zn efflux transporter [Desulfuromonadales bacterium]